MSSGGHERWNEWLSSLRKRDRTRAEGLVERFREAGCREDPEGWARSEIEEDIAQLARFLLLNALWKQTISPWQSGVETAHRFPAARRLLAGGANADDVRLLCGSVALSTLAAALNQLDYGQDADAPDDDALPGWRLMEVAPASTDELTGRDVGGLHESVLSVDPTGAEGREFWAD